MLAFSLCVGGICVFSHEIQCIIVRIYEHYVIFFRYCDLLHYKSTVIKGNHYFHTCGVDI